MSFSVYNSDVTLCSGDNVLTYNIDDGNVKNIVLPQLEKTLAGNKEGILHNKLDIDTYHAINNVSYSKDGEYFLVCTNRKQLCLYRRKDLKLVSNRTLIRAASSVKFSPNNDIIVADKSGDAYLYSSKNPEENGTLLLGHLSMLLDVFVTSDLKYIVTADRDEKIRISMYPNAYNILSYCLGHEKFVTNVQELPHDERILISSGGDGCLKFWDFKIGKELLSVDVNENVREQDIQEFNKCLEDCELEESVRVLPLKHLTVSKIDDETSVVVATLFSCKRLFIYNISGNIEEGVKLDGRRIFDIEDEPLECFLQNNNTFWALSDRGLNAYEFNEKEFRRHEVNSKLEKINESWKILRSDLNKQTLFPILYKRKFDNVQDYHERKKSRLLAKVGE